MTVNIVQDIVAVPFVGNDGAIHWKDVNFGYLKDAVSLHTNFDYQQTLLDLVARIYTNTLNPQSATITNFPDQEGENIIPFDNIVKASFSISRPLPPQYGFKNSPNQINVGVCSFIYDEGYSPVQFINWYHSLMVAPFGPARGVIFIIKDGASANVNLYKLQAPQSEMAWVAPSTDGSSTFVPYDSLSKTLDQFPGTRPPIVD